MALIKKYIPKVGTIILSGLASSSSDVTGIPITFSKFIIGR